MTPGRSEKGDHLGEAPGPAQPSPRGRVVVSRCLLGEAVRYDGRDKHQPALDALAGCFVVVPFCPELAAGFGVPRPPMDWVGARVMDRAAGLDLTAPLAAAVARFVAAAGPIDGAILKAGSPSCGVGSARRYDAVDDAAPAGRVDGLFAAALAALDPAPARIDEAALADRAAVARFAAAVELRRAWRADRAVLIDELTGWAAARGDAAWIAAVRDFTMSADQGRSVGHIDAMMVRTAIDDAPPRLRAAATAAAAVHLTMDSRIAAPRGDRSAPRRETKAGSR